MQEKLNTVKEFIAAKHKFAEVLLPAGTKNYVRCVGWQNTKANIQAGGLLSTANVKHAPAAF